MSLPPPSPQIRTPRGVENHKCSLKCAVCFCVVLLLGIYLFIYHSCTFYSAFFTDPDDVMTVSSAMFNPEAFKFAWNHSFWTLCIILISPFVFLGLGFVLHYYSKAKGAGKYLKMVAIVAVTFLFDCILAYKIGESLHQWQALNGVIEKEAFTVSMAVHDVNFWIVLCCGVIPYLQWCFLLSLGLRWYETGGSKKY